VRNASPAHAQAGDGGAGEGWAHLHQIDGLADHVQALCRAAIEVAQARHGAPLQTALQTVPHAIDACKAARQQSRGDRGGASCGGRGRGRGGLLPPMSELVVVGRA
jgi:hypothetical protein